MKLIRKLQSGFTMIELLIVIAVLGILAAAVLSAIDPIEQINRGKDTASKNDAEQLLSATERYYANKGFYPWHTKTTDEPGILVWQDTAKNTFVDNAASTELVLTKLSTDENELKNSFVSKITAGSYNDLWIYNAGATGDSTYVCSVAKSKAFRSEAKTRCGDKDGANLPTDLVGKAGVICAGYADDKQDLYICLP